MYIIQVAIYIIYIGDCVISESIYNYIFESVCLLAVNAKTTARIGAKRSGITKNDPESVLRGLKSTNCNNFF